MKRVIYFFRSASAGGVLLMLLSALGIVWANSPYSTFYFSLLHSHVGPYPVHIWINDVMMAVFFLFVGLEVKREMLIGRLNTKAKRIFPGLGALCGFLVPAVIYLLFSVFGNAPVEGWAIPTATDIAFALGIVVMLEARVPLALKAFLTALAVIDDLMAIIVIAVFYSATIHWSYAAGAAAITALLYLMNKRGITHYLPYIVAGVGLWYCIFHSGLHATLAGVILALMIPYKVIKDGEETDVHPLLRWEHALNPWVTFLIVPIFGFANVGVTFGSFTMQDFLNPIVLGVALGLFVGKPLGIFTLMWSMIKLKLVPMPYNSNWRHIFAISWLCGIGFTMSLFVSMLAFSDPHILDYAKIGVFTGSLLSAVCGAAIIRAGARIIRFSDDVVENH